ncbi:hypothetical protein B5X24_HaOG215933 [Helicoverpa armigera]|nr:hypothetical protein B5X24_HaOG215933 [Helicoverpa armigera]
MRFTRISTVIAILLNICITKSEVNNDGRVVLVSPVLAPYRSGKAQTNETAKDFPLLTLLATDGKTKENETELYTNSTIQQPIYVQKLKDNAPLLRRRRKISRIYFVHRH